MPSVAVVTDTTQYLPSEVIERHGISLVSLYVNWNDRCQCQIPAQETISHY